jgi:hypothetical protein
MFEGPFRNGFACAALQQGDQEEQHNVQHMSSVCQSAREVLLQCDMQLWLLRAVFRQGGQLNQQCWLVHIE